MNSRLSFVAVAAVLAFCWACDDSPTKSKPQPQSDQPDFPDSVGLKWLYEVKDSTFPWGESAVDTMLVAIESTVVLTSGDSARMWVYYRNTQPVDTAYISVKGDTVRIHDDPLRNYAPETFVFPLTVGKRWVEDDTLADTTRVDSSGTIVTPAGAFSGSHRVVRTWALGLEAAGHIETWFAPRDGIIKRFQWTYDFGGVSFRWWVRIPIDTTKYDLKSPF